MLSLEKISIDKLPNTSTITKKKLRILNINTYYDFINYFPFRYCDYRKTTKISNIVSLKESINFDNKVTIIGLIHRSKNLFTRSRISLQKILLVDDTGKIEITWFNQPYLIKILKKNTYVTISGKVEFSNKGYQFIPEEYELLNNKINIHTKRIIPIYNETRGLSSKTIREKIFYIINNNINNDELFSQKIINQFSLIPIKQAYQQIHFPDNFNLLNKAKNRLAFNEIFIHQLSSTLVRRTWQQRKVNYHLEVVSNSKKIDSFIKSFPFDLTQAQQKVSQEILSDLSKKYPMNRLLQGDVGSGKTVVACIAAYCVFLNHYKTLFMAPTEILAFQHYQTINKIFNNYIKKQHKPKVILVTSSYKPKRDEIASGDIIIGTHALISQKRSYQKIGLVVIDEQHKFGVAQRGLLKGKAECAHLLTMTATPIPRTVSLVLYKELDLSIINQMPPGRQKTKTFLVSSTKRQAAYQWIKDHIDKYDYQVFIICPLIDESDHETLKSIKAVNKEFNILKKNIFTKYSIGLLHGKMKSKDKDKVMKDFINKKYHILVTTSVVEVGVDIKNANIIIIESAQRYGLAQLHQLRGRVGRGDKQAYCILFTSQQDKINIKRLKVFSRINNGFDLAEYDLKNRGTGQLYGTAQHGQVEFKIADMTNFELINNTQRAVETFISDNYQIDKFPHLKYLLNNLNIDNIARD